MEATLRRELFMINVLFKRQRELGKGFDELDAKENVKAQVTSNAAAAGRVDWVARKLSSRVFWLIVIWCDGAIHICKLEAKK